MLAQRKQCRHEGVALLSPFSLGNGVADTLFILPDALGRLTVKLGHEREE